MLRHVPLVCMACMLQKHWLGTHMHITRYLEGCHHSKFEVHTFISCRCFFRPFQVWPSGSGQKEWPSAWQMSFATASWGQQIQLTWLSNPLGKDVVRVRYFFNDFHDNFEEQSTQSLWKANRQTSWPCWLSCCHRVEQKHATFHSHSQDWQLQMKRSTGLQQILFF